VAAIEFRCEHLLFFLFILKRRLYRKDAKHAEKFFNENN